VVHDVGVGEPRSVIIFAAAQHGKQVGAVATLAGGHLVVAVPFEPFACP
jgi:hypothetical protein